MPRVGDMLAVWFLERGGGWFKTGHCGLLRGSYVSRESSPLCSFVGHSQCRAIDAPLPWWCDINLE